MKIGLISDIHGNYEALKVVLRELDKLQVNRIVCLGDVSGYYTQINECCDELRQREIPTVMGNHDWYMASGGFSARSRSVNDCLAYLRTQISPANLRWLRGLPLMLQMEGLQVVHGGWSDPLDEYLQWNEAYFSQIPGTRFASGHTHFQTIKCSGQKVYCNPGSVGQPRDGDPRAAFAVYDGNFTLHRVPYNMQVVFDLMRKAGFSDYYYGSLKTGARNLCKLPKETDDV